MSAEPDQEVASDIGWRLGLTFQEIVAWLQIALSTVHRIYKWFEINSGVEALKQPCRTEARKLDDLHDFAGWEP